MSASVGKARIRKHEAALVHYAHDRLREINSLRIIGNAKDKGPIVSFEIKGAHPHDVATISIAPASPCAPAPIASCRC